jgi:hypothetical protein
MSASWLRRLGCLGGPGERRLAFAFVGLGLALYALGYAAFVPHGATVDDEDLYIEQTLLWVETGSFRVDKQDPRTGETQPFVPGDYPVGMIALMAPGAALSGTRGVFFASFACLLLAVLVTARWLAAEGRSPIFALLLLAFPAAAVGGRLAMSDTARTAVAALGLWLFFRGLDGRRVPSWLASGFVAGAALTLRETAVLPFVPFFAGALLRRDRAWPALLAGGLAGTALHFVSTQLAFGTALFVRGEGPLYPLDLAHVHERLPLYLLGLLVLVPGGLWFGLTYRGRRGPELIASVALFFLFYLGQAFGMVETSFAKRLVIGLRYFDPLLPLLAFATAEALPRQLAAVLARSPRRRAFERIANAGVGVWLAGSLAVAFAVHPVLGRWGAAQQRIRDAIAEYVPRDAVLITSHTTLRKFVDDLARPYVTLPHNYLGAGDVERLRERHGGFWIAALDRTDSAYWQADADENAEFLASVPDAATVFDEQITATDRLRILRVGTPRGAAPR